MITIYYQWLPLVYIALEKRFAMTEQETLNRSSQFLMKLRKVRKWFEEEDKLDSEYLQSINQINQKQEVKV